MAVNTDTPPRRVTPGRIVFTILAVLWTGVGEEFASGGWGFWYRFEVMSVPGHYLLYAATLLLLLPYLGATPRWSLVSSLRQARLWPWVVLGWVALTIGLAIAILSGAPEPFADWRNLVVFGLTAAAAGRWLAAQPWKPWVLSDLAIGYGLVAVPLLVALAVGGGTQVFGIRIPTFHGPLLFMSVFASVAAIAVWATSLRAHGTLYGLAVRLAAVSSSLLVVLSFRRSFWLAWGLGICGLLIVLSRSRVASKSRISALAATLAIGLIVGLAYIGVDNVTARFVSFLPNADNEFSATNEDHVNDLVDALDVIVEEPIFGYGLGRSYETNLIAEWKTDSFEVHNAILHVWLKFGLLGMVAYVGFHLRWIGALWRAGRDNEAGAILMSAAAVYLCAEIAATLVGTWPYGSIQMSVFHGLLLAALATRLGGAMRPTVGQGIEAPLESLADG